VNAHCKITLLHRDFMKGFETREPEFEGRSAVYDGEKWGYVDTTGRVLVPPRYKRAFPFKNGLAVVRASDDLYYLINRLGKPVTKGFSYIKHGSTTGVYAVKTDGKWGYVDSKGKPLIPPRFDRASNFGETSGTARVLLSGKWGLIDRAGEFVLPPAFAKLGRQGQGLRPVKAEDAWGYVDASGDMAISPKFDSAGQFLSPGFAIVKREGEELTEYALINKEGKAVIPFGRYLYLDWLGSHSDDSLQGLLTALDPQTTTYMDKEPKWGVIDVSGKTVVPFEQAEEPKGISGKPGSPSFISMQKNDGLHYMPWTWVLRLPDRVVVEPGKYDHVSVSPDHQVIIAGKRGLRMLGERHELGLLDLDGKVLVDPQFAKVIPVTPSSFIVWKEGETFLINRSGRKTNDCPDLYFSP
jgi:hypothetical protein